MGRRTLLRTLALVAIAATAPACGERSEPVGKLPSAFPATVRGAGDQPVTIGRRPDRVVALEAGPAELIAALGGSERLVGVPARAELPPDTSGDEVVTAAGHIDLGAIESLSPDLIVATADTDRVELSRVEQRTSGVVYIQPARSIADVERATIELGYLLGEPVRARGLAGKIQRAVAEITQRVAGAEPVTVFVDTGFFIPAPAGSLLGDLIDKAGGESITPTDPGAGPLDPAELVRRDPDVYIATSDSRVTLGRLARHPQAGKLTAVQAGRVVIVPTSLVTGAGPNVARALEAIAIALHPDAFR